jgi:hypothetical protein
MLSDNMLSDNIMLSADIMLSDNIMLSDSIMLSDNIMLYITIDGTFFPANPALDSAIRSVTTMQHTPYVLSNVKQKEIYLAEVCIVPDLKKQLIRYCNALKSLNTTKSRGKTTKSRAFLILF